MYLVGDQLLVGHDPQDLQPGRTLEALYLDPLAARVRQRGGVHGPDGPALQLLVDVKSEAATTYQQLDRVLRRYPDLLTRYGPATAVRKGPVQVVVSGNRARALMEAQGERYAAYDGRMADLADAAPASLIPLISDRWDAHFSWAGEGPMPADQRQRLHDVVARAHATGRRVRFWATPDTPGRRARRCGPPCWRPGSTT